MHHINHMLQSAICKKRVSGHVKFLYTIMQETSLQVFRCPCYVAASICLHLTFVDGVMIRISLPPVCGCRTNGGSYAAGWKGEAATVAASSLAVVDSSVDLLADARMGHMPHNSEKARTGLNTCHMFAHTSSGCVGLYRVRPSLLQCPACCPISLHAWLV